MKHLYFLYGFNNYHNRIVKRLETAADYIAAVSSNYKDLENTNFNPNDGLSTTHVINTFIDGDPDYMIVCDQEDTSYAVESRWFVLEWRRTRNGQFVATLSRDVIADYYNDILAAPMFIEKAKLRNNDPQIFNKEAMDFNQIKVAETLLKNNLQTPWLVAYLARKDNLGNFLTFEQTFNMSPYYDEEYVDEADFNANCPFYKLQQAQENYFCDIPENIEFGLVVNKYDSLGHNSYRKVGIDNSAYVISNPGPYVTTTNPKYLIRLNAPDPPILGTDTTRVSDYSSLYTVFNSLHTLNDYVNDITESINSAGMSVFYNYKDKVIKIGSKYYKCRCDFIDHGEDESGIEYSTALSAMNLAIKNMVQQRFGQLVFSDEIVKYYINVDYRYSLDVALDEIQFETLSYRMNLNTEVCKGSNYEIFMTPLKDVTFTDGADTYNHIGSFAQEWFNNLAECYSGTGLYDAQIVPYCPIDQTNLSGYTYALLENNDSPSKVRAVGIYINDSSFTKNINLGISLNDDWKIGNETELYRLVSPNGVGVFEFSPYKNGGVTGFEVDCTLLPISPYIKVNPIFGGLYGSDFDDYRGLICNGDFSIAIISNAWQQYQINNKYYQQIFDRQIDHMEKSNDYQRIQQMTGIVSSGIGGAAGGAITGAAAGPAGAVAGAVVGASASIGGGIADFLLAEKMREENIDYTKDQFGYSLQTVQARPQSLTRSTSYNINNKYFPYIEKYDCTEVEKQALREKLYYNGMTVMRIGRINEFLWPEKTYIKGKLIRMENTEVDYHVLSRIVEELDKGVFI